MLRYSTAQNTCEKEMRGSCKSSTGRRIKDVKKMGMASYAVDKDKVVSGMR